MIHELKNKIVLNIERTYEDSEVLLFHCKSSYPESLTDSILKNIE